MSFCELTDPTATCNNLAAYITDIIEAAQDMPTIRYGSGTASATSAELTALWGPCDLPACAVAVWLNTTTNEFAIWSYVSGTWRSTGTVSRATPYYTEFAGQGGYVQEGWIGNWILDGSGNAYPTIDLTATQLVDNYSFEDWTGAAPDDWTETGPVGATQQTTEVYAGLSSAEIPGVLAPPLNTIYQDVTVTEGRWFILAGALYSSGSAAPTISTNNGFSGSLASTTAGWAYDSYADYSLTTTKRITVTGGLTGLVGGYVDALTLYEIDEGWNTQKEFYTANGSLYVDYVRQTNTQFGLLFNYTDDDNYAMVVHSGNTLYLVEIVAGVAATTNSWGAVYVAGARLEIVRDSGNTVDIDYNGVSIVAAQALASPQTGTIHGIIGTSPYSYASAFGFIPE